MRFRVLAMCLALAAALACISGPAAGRVSGPSPFDGRSIRAFWLDQSAPGAITEVPDPAGSGETVFKFTVGDRDETGPDSPNPRGELLSPNEITDGDEFWASGKFFLPRSFPSRVPEWLVIMQGPFGLPFSGSPPWNIKVAGGKIEWQRNDSYDWDVPWEMKLERGRWINVLVHSRFANHGFVEMWIDGRPVTFFKHSSWNPGHHRPTRRLRMMTMDHTNDGGPNSLYLQNYRKEGMFSSVTLYQGPLRIGPTPASVRG